MLPDPGLFLYQYVRKEALLSSQIEGTQSSLTDLLLYELDEAPGVPMDDVEEVSNYVAALNHGLRRLREDDFPLSLRLIREMHALLLRGGRGSTKRPGEFRNGQVRIGGASPARAHFVPPPPEELEAALSAFERFLHAPASDMPPLIKAALAHVQFETIHPFSDGNGRLGRLPIALILCNEGVLREPSLYLSLYFKRRRADYYEMLNGVRVRGDWEGWLGFFLDAGARSGSVGLVFEQFTRRVLLSVSQVSPHLALSVPTIRSAISALSDMGIVNELTGQRRHRVFSYQAYLEILSEGAQPL